LVQSDLTSTIWDSSLSASQIWRRVGVTACVGCVQLTTSLPHPGGAQQAAAVLACCRHIQGCSADLV